MARPSFPPANSFFVSILLPHHTSSPCPLIIPAHPVHSSTHPVHSSTHPAHSSAHPAHSSTHPAHSKELTPQVEQVHRSDGILGTFQGIVVNEAPPSVLIGIGVWSQLHTSNLTKRFKHTTRRRGGKKAEEEEEWKNANEGWIEDNIMKWKCVCVWGGGGEGKQKVGERRKKGKPKWERNEDTKREKERKKKEMGTMNKEKDRQETMNSSRCS